MSSSQGFQRSFASYFSREEEAMKQLRERLLEYGSETLLTEELLALVLRTGAASEKGYDLARKLLAKYGGLGGLLQAECRELMQEQGLSETRTALLKAVLELGRRLNRLQPEEKLQIKTPADAANLVMLDMAYLDYEQLRVIVLDTRNQVVDNIPLYRGTINSSVLRAAEIFRLAIVRKCCAIIVCHSHPSGSPELSPEDIEITKQLVEAGKVLDVDVLDHLIIGHHRFVSLKERLRW
jgi:DNA repair protein RadC